MAADRRYHNLARAFAECPLPERTEFVLALIDQLRKAETDNTALRETLKGQREAWEAERRALEILLSSPGKPTP